MQYFIFTDIYESGIVLIVESVEKWKRLNLENNTPHIGKGLLFSPIYSATAILYHKNNVVDELLKIHPSCQKNIFSGKHSLFSHSIPDFFTMLSITKIIYMNNDIQWKEKKDA